MTSYGKARRASRWAATAVAAVSMFATAVLGQPPRGTPPVTAPAGPVDAARARQQIADQKAEAEVLAALQDADRLARTNPAKAAQILRAAQTNIDLSGAISGTTRTALTGRLQARLAAIEGKPLPGAAPGARPDPTGTAAKANQKAALDAYAAEVKEVREGVDLVIRLQEARRFAEADREVARLAARYPNNPAVIALTQKEGTTRLIDDAKALAKEQSDRTLVALNDVNRSALPAVRDVEFPKDWKDRTARRAKLNEVQLTAKEKAIIEALDKPLTVSFLNRPLEEVLQELSNQMEQPLLLDRKSLEDLGVDLKKPVSLDAKGISARTVLRNVVGAQGLTFVVKGEAIQVVTVEKARDMLVTRVYYLGDVVQGVGPFGGGLAGFPALDYQQTMANVKVLQDAIQGSIDPLAWKDRGGPCTITFHYPSMAFIVKAPTEVHATLGSKLGPGR